MLIKCNIPDTLVIEAIPSHTIYVFNSENNHIVDVKEEDVPDLLSKQKTMGCCGNPRVTINIFEKV